MSGKTRSGKIYTAKPVGPILLKTSILLYMTRQTPTPPSNQSTNPNPSLVNLLPQAHTIKEFMGENPNYTIHIFLQRQHGNIKYFTLY